MDLLKAKMEGLRILVLGAQAVVVDGGLLQHGQGQLVQGIQQLQ